jgi:YVTN family beta-propeller protein
MGRGGFNDLAITPDGKHAYVTSGKVVSVVDTSTNTVEARVPKTKMAGVLSPTVREPWQKLKEYFMN